jgi:hypothetical protein
LAVTKRTRADRALGLDGRSALARSIRDARIGYLGQCAQPVSPCDYALCESLATIGGNLQCLNRKALNGGLSQIEARLLTTLIGQHSRLLRQLNARRSARPAGLSLDEYLSAKYKSGEAAA